MKKLFSKLPQNDFPLLGCTRDEFLDCEANERAFQGILDRRNGSKIERRDENEVRWNG